MKDLKYLLAYLVPVSCMSALYFKGPWAWTTVILAFGIIPLLEFLLPGSPKNASSEQAEKLERNPFFDYLLYTNALLLYAIVGWYLYEVCFTAMEQMEVLGITLATGIVVGTCGINVAHELGHRNTRFEQGLSKLMLLPALYQHFFVEHNWGHHNNVGTVDDPASSRKGETVYAFLIRSLCGGWWHAWDLEKQRLKNQGAKALSWSNQMWRFTVYQLGYLLIIFLFLSWTGLLAAVSIAVTGMLLLETVNYLEHYGLRRKKMSNGYYEPVSPVHSWNSDHEIGRILLYELTRHSDHHYKSTRKYQVLRHIDESPQLPFGYPAAMLVSLLPPLWFAIMNKRTSPL